ncbi:MAG: riboflavin synthase [candidate division Zixibacteria bacterium]|nr:riboflavin synthase [candidate division Zixibacteria bacterium]
MFTGLIETTGRISALASRGNYRVLTVSSTLPSSEIAIGESIACDGACLTVVAVKDASFVVEASQETLERTIVGTYRTGAVLNLERALQVGSRLGGHFVSGHVDTIGKVESLKRIGESLELVVGFATRFDYLVIEKGSIAINGVSLTINTCQPGRLAVNLIPHTAGETTLDSLAGGAGVNLEFDLIGKYVAKMTKAGAVSGVTVDLLKESGW